MSVITDVGATPNRIALLWKFLHQRGNRPATRDDLRLMFSPPSVRQGASTPILDEALRNAVNLGVVAQVERQYRVATGPDVRTEDDLRDYLEEILTSPDAAKARHNEDVPYALAWLLEQDPIKPPAWNADTIRADISGQTGVVGAFEVTERPTWQQLVYWAVYLGFAWRLSANRRLEDAPTSVRSSAVNHQVIIPDPTAALERHLRRVFARHGNRELSLRDVLIEIGQTCPVMEGGAARQHLARLLRRTGRDGSDGRSGLRTISRSTSAALRRLEARGLVALDFKPDGNLVILEEWPAESRSSHISLKAAS